MLHMKVVENTQKTTEDKVGDSSLGESRTKEDRGKQIRDDEEERAHSEEDDSKFVLFYPHAEKMEKLQSQLEVLMHKKDMKEAGISRSFQARIIWWERLPSQHLYYFLLQADQLLEIDPIMTKVYVTILRGPIFT